MFQEKIVSDNTLASGSSAKIIYNSVNGNLYYNPNNATEELDDENIFAQLINSPDDLSIADFQII